MPIKQQVLLFVFLCFAHFHTAAASENVVHPRLQPYIEVLRQQGHDPVDFVLARLNDYDLLIFDDAWHPVVEPFEFYQELVQTPEFRTQVKNIFVEIFPLNKQPHLDAYFNTEPENRELLYPAFQDDFSGTGWPLQTYFDLLHTVYEVNRELPAEERLRVLAVNAPTYWREIKTSQDVQLFRKSLIGNDYTMYKIILSELDRFESGQKGIFLTNTRHAYKGIKDRNGRYFWNCGTFFYQWHPGKTYSIRFHNLALFVEQEKPVDANTARTTAGMERFSYKWVRMADGLWDSAFAALENKRIALPLRDNIFGKEPYVGNHMHKAAAGQTMYDANDAIIFLAPLEALHNSAKVDFIYTPAFRQELERRYRLLYAEAQLKKQMEENQVNALQELIDKQHAAKAAELIPQARALSAMDAWQRKQ